VIHTVKDENDLSPEGVSYYVRSMSDPTIMIHGRTGDGYKRHDGNPWAFDGLRPVRNETQDGYHLERAHAKHD
jgi:hypothetical protein